MPPSDDLSALGKVRERLYAKDGVEEVATSALSGQEGPSAPHAWRERLSGATIGAPHHVRFARIFFFAGLCFFVLAAGASGFLVYTGGNTVSVNNVAIKIQGPTTVAGGDTAPLSIVITNRNPSALERATLEVTFPEGTRRADDVAVPLLRYSVDLGTLLPGASEERSVSAVLFGAQGSVATIKTSLSFGTERSNATFVARAEYPITISTAPLSVSVDAVSESVSGKEFSIVATVRSNASQALDNVVLTAEYPSGYALTSSSIVPVGTSFAVGSLKAGASKAVTLTGTLTGENGEERVFRFSVGTGKSPGDSSLSVSYMTQEARVRISAPFLSTAFVINGSSASEPAVSPGSSIAVGVTWENTLPSALANAQVSVTLTGDALDPASVKSQKGFYRSLDRTLIFSQDTAPELALLAPGTRGGAAFSFATIPNPPRNAAITLTISIAAERVGQAGVPEQVLATASKTIRLVSTVSFTSSTLHASGPFINSGTVPPAPDAATAYTIRFSVVKSGNDLAETVVTAALPSYVNFTGLTSPTDGSITYDNASRTVTWRIGELAGSASREAFFQVVIIPSTSQRGSAPSLVGPASFSAFDRFAQVKVMANAAGVTTETAGDPGYVPAKGLVQ